MVNNVFLVGRIKEFNDEVLKLSVTRTFKNEEGDYIADIIPCLLGENISKKVEEFCEKDDIVGIRGRLEVINKEVFVIAEKITFLKEGKK